MDATGKKVIADCIEYAAQSVRKRMAVSDGMAREIAADAIATFLIAMPDAVMHRYDTFDGNRLHEVGQVVETRSYTE